MSHTPGPATSGWTPLTPQQVGTLLGPVPIPWWIAGGWALDLFVGRQTREHADTDVLILRRDHGALHQALAGWDLHAADPPGTLRPWQVREVLPLHVHDIWCRPTSEAPWALQVMLLEDVGDQWWFRRDHRIGGAIATLGRRTSGGLPYLTPEVQLLFKAASPRPKDEADWAVVAPLLTSEQRAWLHTALVLHQPGHPWLADLARLSVQR